MADLLGARITTIMRNKLLPMVADTVLRSNVAFTDFVRKAKKWSGKQIEFPIKYQTNSTVTSFTGFDTLSISATNNRVSAVFNPSFVQVSSSLPIDEIMVNGTSGKEEAVLNLIRVTLESDAQDLANGCGTQFWADGTGNSDKDILGLGAAVDDGSNVPTYGGLPRATYTGFASTVTASGGTLSLAKLYTLYYNVASGQQKPTVSYCDDSVFTLYEQLLQPQERYMMNMPDMRNGSTRGTGALELFLKGMPVINDEKATSGVFMMLNGEYIDWYAIDARASSDMTGYEPVNYMPSQIEGNYYTPSVVKGLGFAWTDWIKPTNAMSLIGHTCLAGQLINREPRFCGKLTGITQI